MEDELVGATAVDGGVTTLAYDGGGYIQVIHAPTRTFEFVPEGGQLKTAYGPQGGVTSYDYHTGTNLLSKEQTHTYFEQYEYRYGTVWVADRGRW